MDGGKVSNEIGSSKDIYGRARIIFLFTTRLTKAFFGNGGKKPAKTGDPWGFF